MASRRKDLRWLTGRPIAHRGLHDRRGARPENSLAAFSAAVAAHYAIECDVHLSADGVPVVFHDDELGRLTDASGSVRDRTAAELGDLRLLGTKEWIPTLDELLQLVEGRVPLVIELKHLPGRDGGLALGVLERMRRYGGPAALMSFDTGLIGALKTAGAHLPVGLVAEGNWRRATRHWRAIRRLDVDFVSYRIRDLPTPLPWLARRLLGLPLICWTVRTPEELAVAKRWTDQMTFEGFLP
jgi:glycerophosphoryl diester phosphodiesterase